MTNIDLKLLAVVSELNRTRSVSQTANNLNLSQSAVSMSLAKLRRHFNDPLFVRTSAGMEPTPQAAELVRLLQRAGDLLHAALGHHVVFNPHTSERSFTIHSTDIEQITVMPKLMKRLAECAPGVRIVLRRISEATPGLLESGEADVAIGFIPPMGAGFCQQRLFKERFVCAVRRDHPRIGSRLSLDEFENENHLAIATCGTGHGILERSLESSGIRRRIGLTIPSFLGIESILTTLDYVVTLPEQLGRHLASTAKVKLLPLPVDVPPYYIVQHWHERYTHDPASRWMRAILSDLFSATRVPAASIGDIIGPQQVRGAALH